MTHPDDDRRGNPVDATTAEQIDALTARYDHAMAEIAHLSVPNDHGVGARTARLSGLGAWEIEVERLRRELERLTGAPWPPPGTQPGAER